jgi:hypothetical protein
MSSTPHTERRRSSLPFAALIATASAALALALAGGHGAQGHSDDHAQAAAGKKGISAQRLALHDGMRRLWEDHITWTRLFIVSASADLPDLDATTARLLRNQDDIGDAIKPFYGRAAGERLTELLKEHILVAADILAAAKAGDQEAVERHSAAWYRNGNQIGDFLHEANPDNWPRGEMRRMMRKHLDLTLAEAVAHLQGDDRTDIRTYDRIHRQILHMADMLSDGIAAQFPKRFR